MPSADWIRNFLTALGVIITLGGGIVWVKVDIATLQVSQEFITKQLVDLKDDVKDLRSKYYARNFIERGGIGNAFPSTN